MVVNGNMRSHGGTVGDSKRVVSSLDQAVEFVKANTSTKFDASVDIAIRLGVDCKKSDQMVRGTVVLPYGVGKPIRVLVLCTADKEREALGAGADYAGLDDYIDKISKGWTDVDVIVAMPTVMVKLGRLGKVLGPRGLMPNPAVGTVTMDVGKVVREIKLGRISFKVDKYGIVHSSIGRVSFPEQHIVENAMELLKVVVQLKPNSLKGTYVRSISLSSTMGRGVFVDKNIVIGL